MQQNDEKPWYLIQAEKVSSLNWQITKAIETKDSIEADIKAGKEVKFELQVKLPDSFGTPIMINLGKITMKQALPIILAINNRIEEMNQELRNLMLEGDPNQSTK